MSGEPSRRYSTPAAFRQALHARARLSDRLFNELEREFLLQRFVARVFHQDVTPWVLKGGIGLLIRLPSARFSRDLDLFSRENGVQEAVADLERLCRDHRAGPVHLSVVAAAANDGRGCRRDRRRSSVSGNHVVRVISDRPVDESGSAR